MIPALRLYAGWLGLAAAAAAAGYTFVACLAVWLRRRVAPVTPEALPPVTLLKPLFGAEPGLRECLRSCCEQSYERYEIVCGVRDPQDPAVDIVRGLQREFPRCALELVIDERQHGSSGKVSNLINMMAVARYDHLVLADSDMRVGPDYLARVVAPLADPRVGIVTCAYVGQPEPGLWSRLGAAFINEWFMPSVYVASLFGSRAFAFGATIALRRDTLVAIGGFAAIADQLADDYRLGELTRRLGLETVLSDLTVETRVHEATCSELLRHELRWLRTIRAVRPAGYAGSFVTFSLPVAVCGALLAGFSSPALALLGATLILRLALGATVAHSRPFLAWWWLGPVSDFLGFALWCWGFASRRVHWKQARYRVARDGSVQPIH
jgi:ceramide glucosyltransferase